MKKSILAVLDTVGGIYGNPFFSTNKNTGIRDFHHAAKEPGSAINRSPEDYQLFYLGEFDDVTCSFDLLPAPERVARAFQPLE